MARVLPSRADIRDPGNEFHACSSESAGGWGRRSRVFVVTAPSAGRCWAATTTEGLLIYSLDARMLFDPFELDTSVTPTRVRAALRQRDFTRAILMAFRLNERKLLQEALESVPWDEGEPRARGGGGGGAGGRVPSRCQLAWLPPPSRGRQLLPAGPVRGEGAGVSGFVPGGVAPSGVLPRVGAEAAHGARAEAQGQVRGRPVRWGGCSGCRRGARVASGGPPALRAVSSRAGTLLPAVQFLQKSIQRHFDGLSKLYVATGGRRAGSHRHGQSRARAAAVSLAMGTRVPVLGCLLPRCLAAWVWMQPARLPP